MSDACCICDGSVDVLAGDSSTERVHIRLSYLAVSGFKTFQRETFIGPFDDGFTAIVGPNGLGKTVIADAARFALGANFSSIRVKSAKGVINHRLAQRDGDQAKCTAEIGFQATIKSDNATHIQTRYIRIRRRVVASGQSTYYAACTPAAPAPSMCLQETLPTQTYSQVKKLLKQHGMDLGLVSCCVVNQACLAFDARDAVQLAASMEKLLGTWEMRQEIERLTGSIQSAQQQLESRGVACEQLRARRAELQPEVGKLLRCHAAVERQQRKQAAELHAVLPALRQSVAALRADATAAEAEASVRSTVVAVAEGGAQAAAAAAAECGKSLQRLQKQAEGMRRRAKQAQQAQCAAAAAAKVKRAQLQHRRKQRRTHERALETAEAAAAAAEAALQQAERAVEEEQADADEKQRAIDALAGTTSATSAQRTQRAALVAAVTAASEGVQAQLERRTAAENAHAATTEGRDKAQRAQHVAEEATAAARLEVDAAHAQVGSAEGAERVAEAGCARARGEADAARRAVQRAEAEQREARDRRASESALDRSIGELMQQSAAGKLPGALHGRVCDCTAVTDASLVAPVATALRSTTNLGSTIITSNRATALAALEHVKASRSGCVKCLIIEEQRPEGEERGERARLLGAWAASGAVALWGCLQARPGHEAAAATAAALLRNWVLVDSWAAAERCAAEQKHLDHKFGIVTRSLEVIQPSCEVTCGRRSHSGAIKHAPQPLQLAPKRAEAGQDMDCLGGSGEGSVEQLQRWCEAAAAAVAAAEAALAEAQHATAAARKRAQQAQSALRQRLRQESAAQEQSRRAAAADADAARSLAKAVDGVKRAEDDLAREVAARDTVARSWLAQFPAARRQAAERAQAALSAAQGVLVATRGRCTALSGELKTAKKEAVRLRKVLDFSVLEGVVQQAEAALADADTAVAERQAAYAGCIEECKAAKTATVAAQAKAAEGATQLQHARSSHVCMHSVLRDLRDTAEGGTAAVKAADSELERLSAAIAAAAPAAPAGPLAEGDAGKEQPRRPASGRDAAPSVHDHSAQQQAVEISSVEEQNTEQNTANGQDAGEHAPSTHPARTLGTGQGEGEPVVHTGRDMDGQDSPEGSPHRTQDDGQAWAQRKRRRRLRGRERGRAAVLVDTSDEEAGAEVGSGAPAAEHAQGDFTDVNSASDVASLSAHRGLARRLAELQQQHSEARAAAGAALGRVDRQLIAEDQAARTALRAEAAAMRTLQAGLEEQMQTREALEERRYAAFIKHINVIKAKASEIFGTLTGGVGDVELVMTLDKHVLFAEGILMSVRPDAAAWQAFPLLSGGQQALAALALSLAVHSTLRPAWFLCDEVDAALDVRRAHHLAAYMAASATQFLVISHKPQVFERAAMLVMLYQVDDASAVCCVPVEPLNKLLPTAKAGQEAAAASEG
eukprot:jgi/Ulvmu1/9472/UM052_0041.1